MEEKRRTRVNPQMNLSIILLAILGAVGMIAIAVLLIYGITDPTLLIIFGNVVGLAVNSIAALTQVRD